MKQALSSIIRRVAGLAVALIAGPALAAAPAPLPTGVEVADWISQNTDLAPAQVAIAGPQTLYAVEPLGPSLATGEVVALVRAESVSPDWGAAHGFRSWDAHVLFDCKGGRLRVIRSATYAQPNRQGQADPELHGADWLAPAPQEPSAKLLGAACDPGFAWPLRAKGGDLPAPAPQSPPALITAAAPVVTAASKPAELPMLAPIPALAAAPTSAPAAPVARFAVQVAYGPHAAGAEKALRRARLTLGAAADGLTPATEMTAAGARRRYVALLSGFASADAAKDACRTLAAAGQTCLIRRLGAGPQPAEASAKPRSYLVQVAHGPFEAGARRALQKARGALGRSADGLAASTETSGRGSRRRYVAVLAGFPNARAAADACRTLRGAGQSCLTRASAVAA